MEAEGHCDEDRRNRSEHGAEHGYGLEQASQHGEHQHVRQSDHGVAHTRGGADDEHRECLPSHVCPQLELDLVPDRERARALSDWNQRHREPLEAGTSMVQ